MKADAGILKRERQRAVVAHRHGKRHGTVIDAVKRDVEVVFALGIIGARSIQNEAAGLDPALADRDPPSGIKRRLNVDAGLALDQRLEFRRRQRGEFALAGDGDSALVLVAQLVADVDLAEFLAGERGRQLSLPVRKRAVAIDRDVERRRAGQFQQGCDHAAFRLVHLGGDIEEVLARRIIDIGLYISAGAGAMLDVERGRDPVGHGADMAGGGKWIGFARHGFGYVDLREIEFFDIDADRQRKPAARLRLLRRRLARNGETGKRNRARRQALGGKASPEQRHWRPVERDALDRGIGTLDIGDGDAVDGEIAGQRRADPAHMDGEIRGGDPFGDLADGEIRAGIGIADQDDGGGDNHDHQSQKTRNHLKQSFEEHRHETPRAQFSLSI